MSSTGHAEQLARKGPKSGVANEATRQSEYGRALRAPFSAINAEARRAIVERDVFGYHADSRTEQLADFDPDDLTSGSFRFDDDAQNHREFMVWLRRQQRRGVLRVISTDENTYVRRAAEDGTKWANAQLRKAGVAVAEGQVGVGATFNQALDANQLRLLFERNYDLLEGITSDTSSQISRLLSEGLSQGENPTTIARSISDVLGGAKTRATTLARNEVMYAHARSSLHRYDQFGVGQVRLLTSDPCEACQALEAGGPYTVDEARGRLTQHPNCVCSWAPVV